MTDHPSRAPPTLAFVAALHDPRLALEWTLPEWELAIRLSRRLRLLARLGSSIDAAGLLPQVPAQPRRHLTAEMRLSRWRTGAMTWAMHRIEQVLGPCGIPLVLLKGAAYLSQGLPIAAGRLPSDLDIMVPRDRLKDTLARLESDGWNPLQLDDHDKRYYDDWSHEVPPMKHPIHRLELDLHHNILPPVGRHNVDADRLFERSIETGWSGWRVLQPVDQLLHSAAHLFFDSELRNRIRDLVDLDGLFRHFGGLPGFWADLPDRAEQLGLVEPLALACHFCSEWLETPIPDGVRTRVAQRGPTGLTRIGLVRLLATILEPVHPDQHAAWTQDLAATIFLARYHHHRMPLRLLIPHLWHKLRVVHGVDAASAAKRP